MARRATIFSKYNDTINTLRIAGPYEFNKWDGSSNLPDRYDDPLFQGYTALGYSLGILGHEETHAAHFFQKNQPGSWVSLSAHPMVQYIPTHGGKIAVVIFSDVQKIQTVSKAMFLDVQNVIKTLRADSDIKLIIGISPWGRQQEQKFLDSHAEGCDVLLGSGPGAGLTSSLSPNRQTLLVRAYSKGRTVSMLQIEHFPSRTAKFSWRIGKNITSNLLVLNEKVQANSAMQKTLAPLDTQAKKSDFPRKTSCGH